MDPDCPQHDDFVVAKREDRFGGYEVLKYKHAALVCLQPRTFNVRLFLTVTQNQHSVTRYYRKSITPVTAEEFDDMYMLSALCGSHSLTPIPVG